MGNPRYFFYWIGGWLLRQFLGGWFTMAVRPLMWSLVGAAILGQLVSSIMVLRLSFIEERALQDVRRKLRGPAAVPWRLYVAIGVLAAAMIGLSYPAGRALRLFRPKAKTYTPSKDDDMRPPPRLQRRGAPGGGQRMPPIRPDEGAE